MRSELPVPFVVYYDGWGQMSSCRERKNHEKQTAKRKSKDKQRHQAMSQGFYDQPRQQADCDMHGRLFQPSPEKVRKTDDSDVRRGESLFLFLFQAERSNKLASKRTSKRNHQFQLPARFGINLRALSQLAG